MGAHYSSLCLYGGDLCCSGKISGPKYSLIYNREVLSVAGVVSQ